jgi:hypothetical protein
MSLLANPAAASAAGMRLDVLAQDTQHIWRTASYQEGNAWQQPWKSLSAFPNGLSVTGASDPQDYGPASTMSGDGRVMHICARASPALPQPFIWHRRSDNYTKDWTNWKPIGSGVFASAPAVANSGDGAKVLVAGRGMDQKMWYARSFDAGESWNIAWSAIGAGVFTHYGSAVAASADLVRIYVFGRGTDQKMWYAFSVDGGNSWAMAWAYCENSLT